MANDLVAEWHDRSIFHDAKELAKRHQDIDGVCALLEEINSRQKDYLDDLNTIYSYYEDDLLKKKQTWWDWDDRKDKAKKVTLILLIVVIITLLIGSIDSLWAIFLFGGIASITLFVVSLLITIVLKLIEKKTWQSYYTFEESVTHRAQVEITDEYRKVARRLYNEIDNLYLSSLEPAHREAVLMRRDQERHHQEMLREQRQHQERLEAEQREMRMAQQKLLEIEEERERRYKENRW